MTQGYRLILVLIQDPAPAASSSLAGTMSPGTGADLASLIAAMSPPPAAAFHHLQASTATLASEVKHILLTGLDLSLQGSSSPHVGVAPSGFPGYSGFLSGAQAATVTFPEPICGRLTTLACTLLREVVELDDPSRWHHSLPCPALQSPAMPAQAAEHLSSASASTLSGWQVCTFLHIRN